MSKAHLQGCERHGRTDCDDCFMEAIESMSGPIVPLAVAENLAAALKKIVDNCGKVCAGYELCTHVACQSSYAAWAIADEALATYRATHPAKEPS